MPRVNKSSKKKAAAGSGRRANKSHNGRQQSSATAAEVELPPVSERTSATASKTYWSQISADVDGMLGGYSQVSSADIAQSERLLSRLEQDRSHPIGTRLCADLGAGIGRVTKHLLSHHFHDVDMVDITDKFLERSQSYLGERALAKVRHVIQTPLQEFRPSETGPYDCIWAQWVLSYLSDADLVRLLRRCRDALRDPALSAIVVKENVSEGQRIIDMDDRGVTRTTAEWRALFSQADLHIDRERVQQRFPEELCEVRTFVLRPELSSRH